MRDLAEEGRLPILKIIYEHSSPPHVGQSYGGQVFDLKCKCPVCSAIYNFLVSSLLGLPEGYFDRVGEADDNVPEDAPRGCSAEAISFLSGVCWL